MREIPVISKVCAFIVRQAGLYNTRKRNRLLKHYNAGLEVLPKAVKVAYPRNISIGEHTYMNSGQLIAGANSRITIGKWCALGYNVHIKAQTHDSSCPAGADMKIVEKDIIIGDRVWIGDNVFIREGVSIGNDVIIGANSVVTRDITAGSVMGGVPARRLYTKKSSA